MDFKLFSLFVVIAFVAIASGAVVDTEAQENRVRIQPVVNAKAPAETKPAILSGDIQSRITCDVFLSDQLCALHCIAKGFRGGFCNLQKVCVCRK